MVYLVVFICDVLLIQISVPTSIPSFCPQECIVALFVYLAALVVASMLVNYVINLFKYLHSFESSSSHVKSLGTSAFVTSRPKGCVVYWCAVYSYEHRSNFSTSKYSTAFRMSFCLISSAPRTRNIPVRNSMPVRVSHSIPERIAKGTEFLRKGLRAIS